MNAIIDAVATPVEQAAPAHSLGWAKRVSFELSIARVRKIGLRAGWELGNDPDIIAAVQAKDAVVHAKDKALILAELA